MRFNKGDLVEYLGAARWEKGRSNVVDHLDDLEYLGAIKKMDLAIVTDTFQDNPYSVGHCQVSFQRTNVSVRMPTLYIKEAKHV